MPRTKRTSSQSAENPTFTATLPASRRHTTRRQRTVSKRSLPTRAKNTARASPQGHRHQARRVYTRRVSIPRAAFPVVAEDIWTNKYLKNLPPYFDKFYQLAQLPLTELVYKDNRGVMARLFGLSGSNIFSRIEKVHAEANAFVREKLRPFFQTVFVNDINLVSRYYDAFYDRNEQQAGANFQFLSNQMKTVYCTDSPETGLDQYLANPPIFYLALWNLRHELRYNYLPKSGTFLDEIFRFGEGYLCAKRPQWLARFLSVAHGWMTALSDLSRLIIFMTRIRDDNPLKEKFKKLFLNEEIKDKLPIRQWVREHLELSSDQLLMLFPQKLLLSQIVRAKATTPPLDSTFFEDQNESLFPEQDGPPIPDQLGSDFPDGP